MDWKLVLDILILIFFLISTFLHSYSYREGFEAGRNSLIQEGEVQNYVKSNEIVIENTSVNFTECFLRCVKEQTSTSSYTSSRTS